MKTFGRRLRRWVGLLITASGLLILIEQALAQGLR